MPCTSSQKGTFLPKLSTESTSSQADQGRQIKYVVGCSWLFGCLLLMSFAQTLPFKEPGMNLLCPHLIPFTLQLHIQDLCSPKPNRATNPRVILQGPRHCFIPLGECLVACLSNSAEGRARRPLRGRALLRQIGAKCSPKLSKQVYTGQKIAQHGVFGQGASLNQDPARKSGSEPGLDQYYLDEHGRTIRFGHPSRPLGLASQTHWDSAST